MEKLPEIIALNADIQLEKIALRHAESMFAQIDRHREYLSEFVDWTRFNTQVSDSENFIKNCEKEAENGDSFVWAICVKNGSTIEKTTETVGTISFNKPIDWQNRTALIGYWLSPEMQGKGIVTQGVQAVIEATKASFSHYILRCAVHNQRSNKVAQRCGFRFIETKENAEKIGNVVYAQNIYQKSVE